jgi:hypothetical protein
MATVIKPAKVSLKMMRPRCDGCWYWTKDSQSLPEKPRGMCRRFPPVVLAPGPHSLRPFTDGDDFCGEHKPAEV